MKVVIPMAGLGERFVREGWTLPKPIIGIGRNPRRKIVEYILDMFTDEDEITFICNKSHYDYTCIVDILRALRPSATILRIDDHKKGPIHTVQESGCLKTMRPDEEVIVCYCDNPMLWNRDEFIAHTRRHSLDGCILTHTGFHPHTIASTKMAFVKPDPREPEVLISEIKEKACYTDNPRKEHASTGMYWFRKVEIAEECFEQSMQVGTDENGLTYKGEHYVTLAYNLIVKAGGRVGFYDTPFVTVFGTPEEVRNFEAWQEILANGQIKGDGSAEDMENLISCYRYWVEYNRSPLRRNP